MKHKFTRIKKILIWEPNWIGDIILSLPLFKTLKGKYPYVEITALVKSPGDEILRNNPYIGRVELIPEKGKWGFISRLRKKKFDLAVILPNSFKSALWVYLIGATYRLGYDTEWRGFFLTHPKEKDYLRERHISREFLELLNVLDCSLEERTPEIFLKGEQENYYLEFFSKHELSKDDFLIALHPGASKEPRAWESKKFALLSQELIQEYSAKIIVLGSKAEKRFFNEIKKYGSESVLNATGATLLQTATLIKRCKLFIGNDSGLMHLAAAVNIPIVGIFGPGVKERTGPLLDDLLLEIVSKKYPCAPCRENFFEECEPAASRKPYCLADIQVEDVLKAVRKLVQRIS